MQEKIELNNELWRDIVTNRRRNCYNLRIIYMHVMSRSWRGALINITQACEGDVILTTRKLSPAFLRNHYVILNQAWSVSVVYFSSHIPNLYLLHAGCHFKVK
jgi:hypothetical protein